MRIIGAPSLTTRRRRRALWAGPAQGGRAAAARARAPARGLGRVSHLTHARALPANGAARAGIARTGFRSACLPRAGRRGDGAGAAAAD